MGKPKLSHEFKLGAALQITDRGNPVVEASQQREVNQNRFFCLVAAVRDDCVVRCWQGAEIRQQTCELAWVTEERDIQNEVPGWARLCGEETYCAMASAGWSRPIAYWRHDSSAPKLGCRGMGNWRPGCRLALLHRCSKPSTRQAVSQFIAAC